MLSTEIPACRKKYGMRVEMKLPQTPYGMEVMPKIHEGARRGSVMMGCRKGSSAMVSLCGTPSDGNSAGVGLSDSSFRNSSGTRLEACG
jgi:hypothetical protein